MNTLIPYLIIPSSFVTIVPITKAHPLLCSVYMIMGIQKPAWLEAFCTQKFFAACSIHETAKKNEKNIRCLDCCTIICPHCVQSHRFHRLVQVGRYAYHDVVRLEDLEKRIDCSNVQVLIIRSTVRKCCLSRRGLKIGSLNFKGSGKYCTSCDRSLQEPFIHCSLGCKVDFVLEHYKDLSPYLRICKSLQLSPDFFIPQGMGDDALTDDDESTISDDQQMSCCYSSGSENMSMFFSGFVRKKSSGVMYVFGRSAANKVSEQDMPTRMSSRRKGIPQRSPMC